MTEVQYSATHKQNVKLRKPHVKQNEKLHEPHVKQKKKHVEQNEKLHEPHVKQKKKHVEQNEKLHEQLHEQHVKQQQLEESEDPQEKKPAAVDPAAVVNQQLKPKEALCVHHHVHHTSQPSPQEPAQKDGTHLGMLSCPQAAQLATQRVQFHQ
jgi:hypothetical protein